MAHVYSDPLPRRDYRQRSRAVRRAEKVNRIVRRLRVELKAISCPLPAHRAQRERSNVLTGAALCVSAMGLLLLTRMALRPLPGRPDPTMTWLLQRRHSTLVTRGTMVVRAPGFAP